MEVIGWLFGFGTNIHFLSSDSEQEEGHHPLNIHPLATRGSSIKFHRGSVSAAWVSEQPTLLTL